MAKIKAVIFDMDGVIVDSERVWIQDGEPFYIKLFGEEIRKKVGDTKGITANVVYERATQYGFSMEKEKFFKLFDKQMELIYAKAKISEGLNDLADKLIKLGFLLGLVSSSREAWIKMVLPKIKFRNKLSVIVSINDTPNLRSKPYPDGILEAMRRLKVTSENTIVLEDSNMGIKAAKDSGAFVIGFREFLVPGYKQDGADVYANNIHEVMAIIESIEGFNL